LTTESTWESICAGRSGIARIEGFEPEDYASQIAGECTGFDVEQFFEKKRVREGDRFIHLAMAASTYAFESSGLQVEGEAAERVGTFIGVGMAGLQGLYDTSIRLRDRGPRRISPFFIPSVITNLAPGQVSMRFGYKGPSYTTTSACSSGAHAIGDAARWIQLGHLDAALAGGAEAAVTGLGVGGFCAMRALSKRNDAPAEASRPFDRDRDGFVIAEGAGVLMLEELEHAKARGAKIYGEFVGYGATADAHHLTQPAPEGEGGQRAMKMALRDAGLEPSEITYVNAHGTSTPTGDMLELAAIRSVFGDHATSGLMVSSTKSMHGHLLGAAGGLEAVLCTLAIQDGVVPPTINLSDPDDGCAGLDLVPHEARQAPLKAVLSNSFGFGGTNASLIIKRYE